MENSNHVDLEVSWYLPEVVINERRFQMLSRAQDLLPNLQKMERLLGHAFGIGDDTLGLHVDKAIDDSIKQLGFQVAKLDTTNVNWNDVISRAAHRKPPFERGEKEKGFRDSVIANTFSQMQQESPSTASVCRLAIVTNDERLTKYIGELTSGAKNVRILKSTDELESLINTLVSSVPEEFAAELAQKADKLFFVKEDEKSLYYKEDIRGQINRDYADVLNDPIIGGHLRRSGTWWITAPIFVKKTRQRVHWVSVLEPEFEIYHIEEKDDDSDLGSSLAGLANIRSTTADGGLGTAAGLGLANIHSKGIGQGLLGRTLLGGEPIVDFKGRERFEIHWSASLTQSKNLTKPSVDEIKHLGNNLGDDS
jgi:hypothetical protein